MPKFQVNLSKMTFYEMVNEDLGVKDSYIFYSTDLVRRKYRMKQKFLAGDDQKLVFKRMREKALAFSDWKITAIESIDASDIRDVVKRKKELVEIRGSNLNDDDSRFDPAAYKKEWRRSKKTKESRVDAGDAGDAGVTSDGANRVSDITSFS